MCSTGQNEAPMRCSPTARKVKWFSSEASIAAVMPSDKPWSSQPPLCFRYMCICDFNLGRKKKYLHCSLTTEWKQSKKG